jgi:integrase
MARRSGQDGYIERKGNAYYVRFWIDVPGRVKRVHKSVRICPLSGPGNMTKPERERKAREIIAATGADTEEHFNKVEGINLGVSFRQQAERWIAQVQNRKRNPVKPKTLAAWKDCLRKWLNPNLGDIPLSSVNNQAAKELVSKMAAAGLSAKSMHNYVQVVKMVVASAVNEDGEVIHPRKWNHEFIDFPQIRNQRTPTFTGEEVSAVVASSEGQYQMLYALLGGTGLGIGEALGLEIRHVSDGCTTVKVAQSVWNGSIQSPKTENALREVDLPSALAAMLKEFIAGRAAGFLFQTKAGRSISQSDILNRNLHPILKAAGLEKRGFHAFRRFRTTWLRRERAPEDLIRYWLGHANRTVTDDYSRLKDDLAFRKLCAEKVGLGFQLPGKTQVENLGVVPIGTQEVLAESVV